MNPWHLWYCCYALPTELTSQLGAGYYVGSLETRGGEEERRGLIWNANDNLGNFLLGWILLDDGSLNHDIAFVYKLTILYELLGELNVHE